MTEKEKELILAWIINETQRLEEEYKQIRSNIRFRSIDISDNVEMILIQQRLNDFREFSAILLRLLHL